MFKKNYAKKYVQHLLVTRHHAEINLVRKGK